MPKEKMEQNIDPSEIHDPWERSHGMIIKAAKTSQLQELKNTYGSF